MRFFYAKPCFNEIFGFQRYLNQTFLLKWQSNEMKLLKVDCSDSALLISLFFLEQNREDICRMVRDLNGTRQKEQWTYSLAHAWLVSLNLIYTNKILLNLIEAPWLYYKMHSLISIDDELQISSIDVYKSSQSKILKKMSM